jgi:DNA topoisomerase-2
LYEKVGEDKIHITELPIETATMPYTTFLEGLLDGGVDKNGKKIPAQIKDMVSLCTEVSVDFTVTFPKGKLAELESQRDANGINGVEKMLKLTTSISTTNMHMFDQNKRLHKYTSVEEIIEAFYGVRIEMYGKRKAYLVDEYTMRLSKLSNRARYIQETLNGTIDLRKKKSNEVQELLESKKFDKHENKYDYLIKMPMDSVTEENIEHIMKERDNAKQELEMLMAKALESIWLEELNALEKEYDKYKAKREQIQTGSVKTGDKQKKPTLVKKLVKK